MRPMFQLNKPQILSLALVICLAPVFAIASGFEGRVSADVDTPIVGGMVTFRFGSPFQERTVFTAEDGHYQVSGLPSATDYAIRVRRIGWHDIHTSGSTPDQGSQQLDFTMVQHTDMAKVAAQLPANQWYALALEKLTDENEREQLVRQCNMCHQQGNAATRLQRPPEEWHKVLSLMARMGGGLNMEFREKLPELFNSAYDPETAIPRLTKDFGQPDFAPPPDTEVRRAVIDEYEVGGRSSMQHDMIIHSDGYAYSVDMSTDTLFRLDASIPGGGRKAFAIPTGDFPLGGLGADDALPSNSEMRVGPHSAQSGPDGAVWIALAVSNQLAIFDPIKETFVIEDLPGGIFPHTIRFDDRGRAWYTVAVSNHVGVYDPKTGQHDIIRLPARDFGEEIMLRMLPFAMWLSQWVDMSELGSTSEGLAVPFPYGIDIAPDGGVWFSQLNAHRIGRVDPDTFDVKVIDTPFKAPRRMRFDSKGKLWIPGFSSSLISKFDPDTGEFEQFALPDELLGAEAPYTLNVDLKTDDVWVCATNSDSFIRYQQDEGKFTIYPLPTQVTYTREIGFSDDGSIWSSNSNAPAWQIETGVPRIIRLNVDGQVNEQLADSNP